MKLIRPLIAVSALFALFVACDDSSSASDDSNSFDCSVTNGVVVVSPKKGDSFKLGETITVVYGSDIEAGGFGIAYRVKGDAKNVDITETAVGPEKPDGKTCYEEKVVLDPERGVEASDEAVIRVYPYSNQGKGSNSVPFKVTK